MASSAAQVEVSRWTLSTAMAKKASSARATPTVKIDAALRTGLCRMLRSARRMK